jgi:hypothetical protein
MLPFPAGIIFLRAPLRAVRCFYTLNMRSGPDKNENFAKYKSPEYFDFGKTGDFISNCAFSDGTLCLTIFVHKQSFSMGKMGGLYGFYAAN